MARSVRVARQHGDRQRPGTPPNTQYPECQAQGEVPGDCGEGMHLMSASWSNVGHNAVDPQLRRHPRHRRVRPGAGNWIDGNLIQDNASDCGITLPVAQPAGHDQQRCAPARLGGVYDNLVKNNTDRRATACRAKAPACGWRPQVPHGMASYNNRVMGNRISGNSMAGVTIHSHTPNQDVSGNVIRDNNIGRNNLKGDPDAGVREQQGILIFSAVVPQHELVSGNNIHGNQIAIFTSSNITLH